MKIARKNFDKNFKPWKMANRVFNYVYFSDNKAYFTNGYIVVEADMFMISLLPHETIKKLNGKMIKFNTMKEISSRSVVDIKVNTLEADGIKYEIEDSDNDMVISKFKEITQDAEKASETFISMPIKAIHDLQEATGSDNLSIKFMKKGGRHFMLGETGEGKIKIVMSILNME